jgi:hypothetical protein
LATGSKNINEIVVLERSTRDGWHIALPLTLFFVILITWLALLAIGQVPFVENIFIPQLVVLQLLAAMLWYHLVRYSYLLFFPVIYRVEIHQDRIVLHKSTLPHHDHVLKRENVKLFRFQQRRWWHNDDQIYPIVCETTNQMETISIDFLYLNNSDDFFAGVAKLWGNEFVPPPRPQSILSMEIRLWRWKKKESSLEKDKTVET